MSRRFEEIDWRPTPMGELTLRRRWDPVVATDVYEIKLDDEFLMSSMFTVAEEELARLGLAEATGDELDVVVGGLGLGHTAHTALDDPRVRSLVVVDALAEVIEWHRRGAVPLGQRLATDPRCTLVHGDFFALVRTASLAPAAPDRRRFDAILVDIDHSPRHLLNPGHAEFYRPEGLARLRDQLRPAGIFGLWSNDPPDADFVTALEGTFSSVRATVVTFPNPLQERDATATIYVATAP